MLARSTVENVSVTTRLAAETLRWLAALLIVAVICSAMVTRLNGAEGKEGSQCM